MRPVLRPLLLSGQWWDQAEEPLEGAGKGKEEEALSVLAAGTHCCSDVAEGKLEEEADAEVRRLPSGFPL